MNNKPTPEQIEKLPRWAQQFIKYLEMEREHAIRELNEYCDSTTPSPYYTDNYVSTGEKTGPSVKTRFIQAHRLMVDFEGVTLQIIPREGSGIELQWYQTGGSTLDDVIMQPRSYQAISLKLPRESK